MPKLPNPEPVLKWAGGKRQLISVIEEHLPDELKNGEIKKFVEPMVGGAAVFFYMKNKYSNTLKTYHISDYNWDLFVLYRIIRWRLTELVLELQQLADDYLPLPPTKKGDKDGARIRMYNQIRSEYNDKKWEQIRYLKDGISFRKRLPQICVRRAAMTIFLNRTCFNGLYRVNSKGEFNVPHGRYNNPNIVDLKNLRAVRKALRGVKISVGTYEDNLSMVDEKTFVYFDPPYRPLPNTPSFTDYHKAPFGDLEQKTLAENFAMLDEKGAKLMLSNSDPKNTDKNDDFFDDIYSKFTIHRVLARRNINSDGERRGKITEILVTNY